MTQIDISKIRRDGGTQIREKIDHERVQEYAEDLDALPPVTVFHDGTEYWLADGFHRVAAAESAGRKKVEAEVKPGTRRDAVLYACGANAAHGLRRTNADKRRAVETLLRDAEWSQWSDREVARRACVHNSFASKMRHALSTSDNAAPSSRKTSDGRDYPSSRKPAGPKRPPPRPGDLPKKEPDPPKAPPAPPPPDPPAMPSLPGDMDEALAKVRVVQMQRLVTLIRHDELWRNAAGARRAVAKEILKIAEGVR